MAFSFFTLCERKNPCLPDCQFAAFCITETKSPRSGSKKYPPRICDEGKKSPFGERTIFVWKAFPPAPASGINKQRNLANKKASRFLLWVRNKRRLSDKFIGQMIPIGIFGCEKSAEYGKIMGNTPNGYNYAGFDRAAEQMAKILAFRAVTA